MAAIVEHPAIVKESPEEFGDLFADEPERRYFADYLTGLLIAEKKTTNGMSREFAGGTDQSCPNRRLTEADRDEKAPNDRRSEMLRKDKTARYHPRGVIAIGNTLIDHAGKQIRDVGWFRDHGEERYSIGNESTHLGSRAHPDGISSPPDRHGDIPSGRKTGPGLGDCQVIGREGRTRHFCLVSTACSLLMRALHSNRPREWARHKLTTIGEACRAVKAEPPGKPVDRIFDKAVNLHWSAPKVEMVMRVPHA